MNCLKINHSVPFYSSINQSILFLFLCVICVWLIGCTNEPQHKVADVSLPGQCHRIDTQELYWKGVKILKGSANAPRSPEAERGIRIVERAANCGNSAAQGFLGIMYFIGKYTPKDINRSVDWLMKASSQGEYAAILMLFSFYLADVTNSRTDEYFVIIETESKNKNYAARYVEASAYCLGYHPYKYDLQKCNTLLTSIKKNIDNKSKAQLSEALKLSEIEGSIRSYVLRNYPKKARLR